MRDDPRLDSDSGSTNAMRLIRGLHVDSVHPGLLSLVG